MGGVLGQIGSAQHRAGRRQARLVITPSGFPADDFTQPQQPLRRDAELRMLEINRRADALEAKLAGTRGTLARATGNSTRETVRATTSDGTSVVARVAIDARSAGTRSALEQERQQVSLMLQNSVASHPHQAILGARGIQRLSSDMRDRLNEFLASRQVEPVRDVVIQDLLVKQR